MHNKRAMLQIVTIVIALAVFGPIASHAALTATPLTWNTVGLDSNSPAAGPKNFPVGARVCSDIATTDVVVNFVWDSANPYVNLRPGSLASVSIPAVGAGSCADAYFEAEVTQVAAAYDTSRRYHISATDGSGSASTTVPRELYVEKLVSQGRNYVTDIKFGPNLASLTSVPAGGSMNLVVGNTYVVQLLGGTATQGYNQFEEFINFSTTIFQILSVNTSYSADDSPFVPNPDDKLYADACGWQNDPNSPAYRSCVGGDYKAGGSSVVTTYTIKVIGGGGTNQTLNTLLYDFSGSSFHYNSDYSTGARIAAIVDPTLLTFSKAFSPNPTNAGGVSTLTFTIGNPTSVPVTGLNFTDTFPTSPGAMVVAATPGATTSGCGTPLFAPVAGAGAISFSNGSVAANSSCTVSVKVTVPVTGTYTNTSNNLFVGTSDTGHSATANLTVNTAPPPPAPICGQTLANWTVPTGTTANPPDLAGGLPTVKAVNVATATASASVPASTSIKTNSGSNDNTSWSTYGYSTAGQYVQFAVDTTNYSAVQFSFFVANASPANGPTAMTVSASNDGINFTNVSTTPAIPPMPGTTFTQYAVDLSSFTPVLASGTRTTTVRIRATGAKNNGSGASLDYDNIKFVGCMTPQPPTISKSFSPATVAVGQTSTLTFTITNPNSGIALSGIAFTDTLPAGVTVTSGSSAQCGGTLTRTAPSTISFTGGTLAAGATCNITVTTTATSSGPHNNVSGFISSTEGGTNTGVTGVATATLTAIQPPSIEKHFSVTPILPNGVSPLVFTITNPNQNDALGGVAFSDTFPAGMVVAPIPNASTSGCGSPVFSPAAGAGSIAFSGGSIAAAGTCAVSVDVTASTVGTYNNTTGNVSAIINAQTVNGNSASDSLVVAPPNPSIALLKQIGLSATGPWGPFEAVAVGTPVYYQFTVENTGDVPLSPVSITDNAVDVSTCNAQFATITLAVPNPNNENHIARCVVGPVSAASGVHVNTAFATGTYGAAGYNSSNSSATYATTGLTIAKSVTETSFLVPGDQLHYSYLVTNSGFATLDGPVTVTDDKASVTCPALNTIGDFDNFFDPSESMTCTATYVVTPADVAAGFVTNTAFASAGGVSSPTDSRTVFAATSSDVSMVKTLVTAGPYSAGQSISYTLVVANAGPSTATNIQVTDTPTNLTITNVSGACTALPCTIASLAPGANATINVTATIIAAGAFDNSATAIGVEPDPNPGNNTDNTGNGGVAAASADVSIVKTIVTPGPYSAGQSISYTLLIANAGPSTATNIQVVDTPTNMTITNVSGACTALPCTIASLASGANTTITVTATIIAAGTFNNTATATAVELDPNPTNNTSSSGGTAVPSADVSIVKTLTTAGPYTVGQSITYTLVVANAGPSTATNIQVTDTPTNLTITNVSGGGCAALPCTIASLASGANVTITVTATINTAAAFDNSATAIATEFDPNNGNNTDNTGNGGTAGAAADVSVVKTLVTAGPYTIGQSISYTLVVANAGPSTATNIQVVDTPANLTITNVSGACTALPCTIASLASGANTTINVTATINAAGAFDNSVTVTATEFDPNGGNNTDNTGNAGTAGASADVSIVKTLVTAGPYSAGQSISYTLVVANAGPSTATNIQVTDTPTNLTITSVSGACTALPCTIASLASGANTTINMTATINAAGAFNNSATAIGVEPDPNPGNNTDNTGNGGTANASADVSIVKTLVTAGPYSAGQSISYTLVVANAGPSAATNIQVTDTPTNLTITNVSGACTALPCTIASLASGANTTTNVTATINAGGAFNNVATATATETDPNPGNNTDSTGNGGTANASADVSMVKTLVTPAPYTVGQSVSYTLVVANAGPSSATNIQVTDTPTNLTITSVSGACTALPCTIASIASGANATINVTATINAAGAFDNGATATATEPDPNPGNNTDNTGNGGSATASADVSMVKTLTTAGPYTVGQSINYTLVVANAGPSTATNIQVTDSPSNLTITNVSGACTALPCTIASLASGANATINVTATINNVGPFDNAATATATEPDPNPANNTDNTGNGGTTGAVSTDIAITKTASSQTVAVGQTFNYTLVVTNNGPATATNVVVTDLLPSNFSLVSATSTQGTCSGTTTVTCNLGTMANAATATITIRGTVTDAGSLANTATVTLTESDTVMTNNASTATPMISADIPTLGEYGLMLLGVLLALAGAIAIRPRS